MAPSMQSEIERKYDVEAASAVPELAGVGPIAATAEEKPVRMRAVYYDTADRALSRGRITMRRREGGGDQGWHVKLPGATARTELHVPLTRTATVPKEVRSPVLAYVGRQRLEKIARLNTTRTVVRLLDADGGELAELADDLVEAVDLRGGERRAWREWEVELKAAAPESDEERSALLDAVASRLAVAGAHPASSVSKLARATGRTGTEPPVPQPLSTAGDLATAVLSSLVDRLRAADPWVRLDTDDSVHAMRIVSRRLRSVLAGSRRALAREVTDPVRAELAWLGGLLGRARDAEVARERIDAAFDRIPDESEARDRLHGELDARYHAAHRAAVRALHSDRYLALLAALDGLVAAPPVTPDASRSAHWLVRRSLRHEARRVARAETAAASEDASVDDRHALRKAAKRLRYVGEAWGAAAGDEVPKRMRPLARRAEDAANALGDERDAGALQEELRQAAERAHRARERSFGYGVAFAAFAREERSARRKADDAVAALIDALPE